MITPDSGDLRHKLDYYIPGQETQSDTGNITYVPSLQWTTRAAIRPLIGKESERLRSVYPEATKWLWLRYCADKYPSPVGWFLFGTRRFDIDYVENVDELNRWVRVLVHEQVQN